MPSLSKFLSVALFSALAQSLPFSEKDLATRATGEKVDGSLYVPASSTASLSSSWSAPSSPATVKLSSNNGLSGGPVSYQLFTGNGQQWPAIDKWMDFEDMFEANKPIMRVSCTQWNQENNSEDEINAIEAGIKAANAASGVDPHFILAIIMQETGGCVRVPINVGYVKNPGLMQDHNGQYNCNTNTVVNGILNSDGSATTPCPSDTVAAMILEGSAGTPSGDGLAESLNQALRQGGTEATAYYWAARIYNTGSYPTGSDLGAPVAGTACYASDIANRLLGWADHATPCTLKNPW